MSMSEVSEELHEDEPPTPASLPKLIDTSSPAAAEEESDSDSSPELPLPRWLFNLIGHVLAALLGLILGYLILARLRPLTFPLPWYH
jgi:ABC-type branched-subunit amino acid transport system permease subunit